MDQKMEATTQDCGVWGLGMGKTIEALRFRPKVELPLYEEHIVHYLLEYTPKSIIFPILPVEPIQRQDIRVT